MNPAPPDFSNSSYDAWVSVCRWEVRSGADHLDKLSAMLDAIRDLDQQARDEVVRQAGRFLEDPRPDRREFASWILQALAPESATTEASNALPESGLTQVRLAWYLHSTLGDAARSLPGVEGSLQQWKEPPHFSTLTSTGIWYDNPG